LTQTTTQSSRSILVSLRNVGLRYGSGTEVLSDLDLELETGSFHFLTGRSGAGKSSLLSLLQLARRPSRGLMTLFQTDINEAPDRSLPRLRRMVGSVYQDFRLLEHLTVSENVALPLRLGGRLPADEIDTYVAEMLRWVGLADRSEARPTTLSGGEKQRVAIARAVIGGPKLLLADEPTGNVDREMGERLMGLFVRLNQQGTTVLIATHDPTLPERFRFPVLNLDKGQLGDPA